VATFDVSVPKPLGAELQKFPNRPGVGIAQVKDGGGCLAVNQEVLTKDGEGMWILEGDEIVAVEGVSCAGDLDKIVELVMASEGDRITVTLSRNYLKAPKGPIKVVFRPSGNMMTVSPGNKFSNIAASLGEDDGWYQEVGTGKMLKISEDEVPGNWDNVMPMTLVAAQAPQETAGGEDNLYNTYGDQ